MSSCHTPEWDVAFLNPDIPKKHKYAHGAKSGMYQLFCQRVTDALQVQSGWMGWGKMALIRDLISEILLIQ